MWFVFEKMAVVVFSANILPIILHSPSRKQPVEFFLRRNVFLGGDFADDSNGETTMADVRSRFGRKKEE